MNITPLEIRQKEFDQKFRGYDKEEVNAYLLSLSKEWERLQDEAKEFRIKLEASEREVQKLREVESSLYKTLKTAEDTGANMIEQATRSAELHLKETQMKADTLMHEAKEKARNIIERAEAKARDIIESMNEEVRTQEEQFRKVEELKDNLLDDLRRIAGNTLDRADKFASESRKGAVDEEVKRAKSTYRSYKDLGNEEKPAPAAKKEKQPEETRSDKNAEGGSFFDQI